MKKSLFLLMLTASLGAYVANHEVKMLDNGKDGRNNCVHRFCYG